MGNKHSKTKRKPTIKTNEQQHQEEKIIEEKQIKEIKEEIKIKPIEYIKAPRCTFFIKINEEYKIQCLIIDEQKKEQIILLDDKQQEEFIPITISFQMNEIIINQQNENSRNTSTKSSSKKTSRSK